MGDQVLVFLLRQDPEDFLADRKAAVEAYAGGRPIRYERRDPTDAQDLLQMCREEQPHLVIPTDVPIPTLAMQAGYTVAAFTPDGLRMVESVVPVFTDLPPLRQ